MWLWRKLWRLKPARILDMGGGRTAALLSFFARERARKGEVCAVISIDESCEWLARTRAELTHLGLEDYCRLLYCPTHENDASLHGYDLGSVFGTADANPSKFDFVVIDGPSGGWGRRNTFPAVVPYLAKKAGVLVDDADRPAERKSIDVWLESHVNHIRSAKFLPLPHGPVFLTVHKEWLTSAS
jgi:hypothetical protein